VHTEPFALIAIAFLLFVIMLNKKLLSVSHFRLLLQALFSARMQGLSYYLILIWKLVQVPLFTHSRIM